MNEATENIVLTFRISGITHKRGGQDLVDGTTSREYLECILKKMDREGNFPGFHVNTGGGSYTGSCLDVKNGSIATLNYVSGENDRYEWSHLRAQLTPAQFVDRSRPIEFERHVTINSKESSTKSINSEGL